MKTGLLFARRPGDGLPVSHGCDEPIEGNNRRMGTRQMYTSSMRWQAVLLLSMDSARLRLAPGFEATGHKEGGRRSTADYRGDYFRGKGRKGRVTLRFGGGNNQSAFTFGSDARVIPSEWVQESPVPSRSDEDENWSRQQDQTTADLPVTV